jgi:hypothetical protein
VQTSSALLPGDTVEATVSVQRLKAAYSGDWTCVVGLADDTASVKQPPAIQVTQGLTGFILGS